MDKTPPVKGDIGSSPIVFSRNGIPTMINYSVVLVCGAGWTENSAADISVDAIQVRILSFLRQQ